MRGEDIPYQLRPNKFIDRQMFVDLLSRLIVPRGPEKYIYVSMGGSHLVDHYAVYKDLGIRAQFSFDQSRNAVARQMFNRPTDATHCEEMNSADLPTNIDRIMKKFPRKRNLIVWLDYTGAQWKAQLQEAVETLVRLRHGDVFRMTMNADRRSLRAEEWQGQADTPAKYRASVLRKQVEDFLPTAISEISDESLPLVLSQCFEIATQKARSRAPNLEFSPVLITSYADGARMVTVTCSVRNSESGEAYPTDVFKRWKFACRGWHDIALITAPILSSKERHKLDANLKKSCKRMLSALKFMPADDESKSLAAVTSYKTFHRYYPAFRHVDD